MNNNGILNKYIVNKDITDEIKIEEIDKETNIPTKLIYEFFQNYVI